MISLNRLVVAAAVVAMASATQAQTTATPAADYSREAFVVEQTRTSYRFENDGTGRRESTARIRVQSDAGVEHWGQLIFGYNAATERIDIQYVRVHKAAGVVVTAPPDAVQELSSPVERVAPVYTDFRQKHVTVPSLRPGETLEFSVVTTIHTPLAAGQFWMEHDTRQLAVTLDDRIEVDVPAGRAITLRTAPQLTPQTSESGGRRVYRWATSQREPSEAHLETLRAALASSDGPLRAGIRLTTFQSWEEVGRWYAAVEQESRAVTPELRAKAQELTAGKATDLEKLEALYNYVALHFRYVSISLGAGRYRPRAASDVFRDQYGDCKDKHTLLVALMASVGLRASTVLIHSEQELDPGFPSPSQFDHVITRADLDGQAAWLDVTTEIAPFRLLSPALRNKQALVIDGVSGRLELTPADPPMTNLERRTIEGQLGDRGALTARVSFVVRGDAELSFRALFRGTPSPQWKELIESIDESAGLDGDVGKWNVSDPSLTNEPFTIEYDVTKANFVDWSKKTDAISLPMSSFELPQPDEKLKKVVELGSATQMEYRARIVLGPGYVARPPQSVTMTRDYADYTASYALSDRTLTAERTLSTRTREIAAARYSDYAAFRRVVDADAAQKLSLDILASSGPRASDVAERSTADLLRSAMDAAQQQDFEQMVLLLKQVLAQEPENARAWSILGGAYAATRQYDAAIAAFEKQIAIDAFSEVAYAGLGMVYQAQGRHTDAEAAFKKQLEIAPLDDRVQQQLATLYLQTKRFADAIPLLERASAAASDNAGLHVSRGYAYLNAGREDAALEAFDKAIDLAPTATTRNNVAYYLSEKGVQLDRAQQYAEAAVTATAVESRNFNLSRVTARELGVVGSLASYWDTLGWVYFAKNDLARAETLLAAAWRLSESAVIGDHLAQVYERQGRKELAIQTYAAASSISTSDSDVRERLRRLSGTRDTSALERAQATELPKHRTVSVKPTGAGGTAEFFVLLDEKGLDDVRFVAGAAALNTPAMIAALRAADYAALVPVADVVSAKVIRRGALTCPATPSAKDTCSFILYPMVGTKPLD